MLEIFVMTWNCLGDTVNIMQEADVSIWYNNTEVDELRTEFQNQGIYDK